MTLNPRWWPRSLMASLLPSSSIQVSFTCSFMPTLVTPYLVFLRGLEDPTLITTLHGTPQSVDHFWSTQWFSTQYSRKLCKLWVTFRFGLLDARTNPGRKTLLKFHSLQSSPKLISTSSFTRVLSISSTSDTPACWQRSTLQWCTVWEFQSCSLLPPSHLDFSGSMRGITWLTPTNCHPLLMTDSRTTPSKCCAIRRFCFYSTDTGC